MQAGKLRHRVTLQKQMTTKNANNEDVVTWVRDSDCWAHVRALRGREYFAAQQVQAGVTHTVRMRYQTLSDGTKIGPNCRIKHGDDIMLVRSAITDERKRQVDMLCVEEVP